MIEVVDASRAKAKDAPETRDAKGPRLPGSRRRRFACPRDGRRSSRFGGAVARGVRFRRRERPRPPRRGLADPGRRISGGRRLRGGGRLPAGVAFLAFAPGVDRAEREVGFHVHESASPHADRPVHRLAGGGREPAGQDEPARRAEVHRARVVFTDPRLMPADVQEHPIAGGAGEAVHRLPEVEGGFGERPKRVAAARGPRRIGGRESGEQLDRVARDRGRARFAPVAPLPRRFSALREHDHFHLVPGGRGVDGGEGGRCRDAGRERDCDRGAKTGAPARHAATRGAPRAATM